MKNKLTRLIKSSRGSKHGFTLVEAIVSVLILAIVVIAVVQTIALTRQSILKSSVSSAQMAQAELVLNTLVQNITPTLDTTVSPPVFKEAMTIPQLEGVSKATHVPYGTDFVCTDTQNQFFTYVEDKQDGHVYGYKITVGVFGADKKTLATVHGYAGAQSDAFSPKE